MLDTCALLSLAGVAERKLSRSAQAALHKSDALYVSACSLYEISLKVKRGRLPIHGYEADGPSAFWENCMHYYGLQPTDVSAADFHTAVHLPEHHREPFDRIIIAQALRLGATIVTYDKAFTAYAVPLIE